jgi:hypothetical protein
LAVSVLKFELGKADLMIRLVMLAAAAVSVVAPGAAAAKHRRHLGHAHRLRTRMPNPRIACLAQTGCPAGMWRQGGRKSRIGPEMSANQPTHEVVLPQNAGPGSMRYYGGPKSPMWREVR